MTDFVTRSQETKPSAVKTIMQYRFSDWPIYTMVISLGQVSGNLTHELSRLRLTIPDHRFYLLQHCSSRSYQAATFRLQQIYTVLVGSSLALPSSGGAR